MIGMDTWHKKRMELLDNIMEGRDYGESEDFFSDRSRWRQDGASEKAYKKTCWKQQKTTEETRRTELNASCWKLYNSPTARS